MSSYSRRDYYSRDDGRRYDDRERDQRLRRDESYSDSNRRPRSRSNSRSRYSRTRHDEPSRIKREDSDPRAKSSYANRDPYRSRTSEFQPGSTSASFEPVEKELPNFEVSGVLAEDQNQLNGVALIFALSVDSAVPDKEACDWRLFEFAGDTTARTIKLGGFSCFLFGTETRLGAQPSDNISFVELQHKSCSKQHAVIQFRRRGEVVKPYVMDLDSTNKTLLNGEPVEPGRYVELRHQDILTFGRCDSDFVLMNALEA